MVILSYVPVAAWLAASDHAVGPLLCRKVAPMTDEVLSAWRESVLSR